MKTGESKDAFLTENPEIEKLEITEEQRAELLAKVDTESAFRNLSGWQKNLVDAICILMGIWLLLVNYGSIITVQIALQKIVTLGMCVFLGFLIYPTRRNTVGNYQWYDVIIAFLLTLPLLHYAINYNYIVEKMGSVGGITERILGAILIIALLEVSRRCQGPSLAIVCVVFMIYGYFGRYMPGLLLHKGIPINRIIDALYLGQDGIFGIPLGTGVSYIYLFVFFATLIAATGMEQLFNDLALSVAGGTPGGPAKVAVISSGLFGMINGTGATNVLTTGIFTIPLMKKLGYKSEFAGAVEAVASSGGQIMPPIMGSVAFIMAEFVGEPYKNIMIAATIPAVLYFLSCYLMVHQEARRLQLQGIPKAQIPKFTQVLIKQGILFLPIVVLTWFLLKGYTAIYAAYYAMASLIMLNIVLGILGKYGIGNYIILKPKKYWEMIIQASKNSLGMVIATASVGIVVGILSSTGLGMMLSNFVVKLAGGNLFLTLIYVMIACIVLGMGLPITPCYIIVATVCVPALIQLGVPKIAAHMFILYFGCASSFTPPVCLAAFAAAGLCGESIWKVGYTSMRIGIATYLVPFAFVYDPQLLLRDVNVTLIWVLATAIIGIYCLAAGSIGFLHRPINIFLRILLIASAVLCIYPEKTSDLIGILIFGAILLWEWVKNKKTINKEMGLQQN